MISAFLLTVCAAPSSTGCHAFAEDLQSLNEWKTTAKACRVCKVGMLSRWRTLAHDSANQPRKHGTHGMVGLSNICEMTTHLFLQAPASTSKDLRMVKRQRRRMP